MSKLVRIAKALNEIKDFSGRNDKTERLVNLLEDKELQPLVSLMYKVGLDDQISTFITKLPKANGGATLEHTGHPEFNHDFIFELLTRFTQGQKCNKDEWQIIANTLETYFTEDEITWVKKAITKDWTLGTSISTYNTAAKAVLVETIDEYDTVRVSNIQDADIDYSLGAYVSTKKDGVNGTFEPEAVIRSRNGNLIPLAHLEAQMESIKGKYVLMGELVSSDRQSSSGLCNSAIKLGYETQMNVSTLQFHVFDAMTSEEYQSGIYTTTFEDRMKLAESVVSQLNQPDIILVEHTLVHSIEEVYAINDKVVEQGEEGVIINAKDMLFMKGRSTKRARIKEVLDGDFEIVDYFPHSRNPEWVGSLVCVSRCRTLTFNTGSGLNEIEGSSTNRKVMKANFDQIKGKIAKVKYNKVILNSNSTGFTLFIPVITEVREPHDKSIPDAIEDIILGSNQKLDQLRKKLK